MSILAGAIGFVVGFSVFRLIYSPKNNLTPTDQLKNALLTYAISKIKRRDFDPYNMNYKSFDGTKLPMLSGFSLNNAYFTYMTVDIFGKTGAIMRYLKKNLSTTEQVIDFLDEFVAFNEAESGAEGDVEQATSRGSSVVFGGDCLLKED